MGFIHNQLPLSEQELLTNQLDFLSLNDVIDLFKSR